MSYYNLLIVPIKSTYTLVEPIKGKACAEIAERRNYSAPYRLNPELRDAKLGASEHNVCATILFST